MNLASISRNCTRLLAELHGGGELCAVVKADGYGHGMVSCAEAALAGGATWLAVAGMGEARDLVADGEFEDLEAPLLLLGPICSDDLEEAIVHGFDIVVWSEQCIAQVLW